jgi:hypothetical protein
VQRLLDCVKRWMQEVEDKYHVKESVRASLKGERK